MLLPLLAMADISPSTPRLKSPKGDSQEDPEARSLTCGRALYQCTPCILSAYRRLLIRNKTVKASLRKVQPGGFLLIRDIVGEDFVLESSHDSQDSGISDLKLIVCVGCCFFCKSSSTSSRVSLSLSLSLSLPLSLS